MSLIVAGDLYARVKDLCGFIPDDIDYVYNCNTEYYNERDSLHMPRKNNDTVVNTFGHSLIELCCTHDMRIRTLI